MIESPENVIRAIFYLIHNLNRHREVHLIMSNSAKRGRLKQIACDLGEPIESLVPRIVNEEGTTYKAAQRLGVAPNTINYWMKKLGYQAESSVVVIWHKTEA